MPFATRGNRNIHYRLDGKGEQTLLFANSLGQSLNMWDQQTEALKEEFRIIRFDHRGHGGSEPDGEAATIHDLALDTLAVLDAAGAPSVHFIGLSLGGMIGQQIAIDAPERLLSLTLCATAAYLPLPKAGSSGQRRPLPTAWSLSWKFPADAGSRRGSATHPPAS